MTDVVMDECKHGVPLVNGMGCMICSNRTPADKVFVKLKRDTRETAMNKVLCSLTEDFVEEVPVSRFA